MMRAEELRIGNLLLAHGNIRCVKSITEEIQNGINRGEYQPIPLTKEWLVKFGFDERMHGWWSDTIFLRNDENHYYYWFDWNGTNESKGVHIKHVHQLQNLYFAITGEELIIKE